MNFMMMIKAKIIRRTSCMLLILSLLHANFNCQVNCQEQNSTNVSIPPKSQEQPKATSPEATTTEPTSLLLSGEEFVDLTEAPIPLFDDKLAANDSSSQQNSNVTATTTSTTIIDTPTTAPSSPINDAQSTTVSPINSTSSPVDDREETTAINNGTESVDYSEEENNEDDTKEANGKLAEFYPPQNVSQYMDYIERLFHDLRHQITDLFEPHIPQLIRTSQMVQLSGSCSYDMLRMALALRQFEPWALKMIDSSGKVPEGIFEGSFTALGSYDECLNIVFAQTDSASTNGAAEAASSVHSQNLPDQNQAQIEATRGKYCLVNVSPYLPPKPPADRVERLFQEEANRRNYTKDDQFSRLSPMFYYMKFRIGVCIPSTCLDSDMHSISEALSSSLKLNITVPHCRVRQTNPLTNHQLVGGLIFALVVAVVISATLLDCSRSGERDDTGILLVDGCRPEVVTLRVETGKAKEEQLHQQQQQQQPKLIGDILKVDLATQSDVYKCRQRRQLNFSDRMSKHWSWMSFSLLANFKLYFENKPVLMRKHHQSIEKKEQHESMQHQQTVIRCLNGIRVLSLCWVIVANSYITLDPRATKRLTKTREAPKDFLFQMVVQASLAIETFFFLSGILMSLSFTNRFEKRLKSNETQSNGRRLRLINWIHLYVHRYIRMTPATMLVIAFSMFAYRYGDGPLWFEATHKAHASCSRNWWRHLLHVANFIDTRQMCFIHYWYIAADMQLFLFAPILMFLLYKRRRLGLWLIGLLGSLSVGFVFYTTYARNLPPTLLFYNSDPESRREFGNTIMTNPLTHVLPYMVGMLVGKLLAGVSPDGDQSKPSVLNLTSLEQKSMAAFLGSLATMVALVEVFLPYKWNNSLLPTKFLSALYAALFRFAWSLALAYLVISCRHKRGRYCEQANDGSSCVNCSKNPSSPSNHSAILHGDQRKPMQSSNNEKQENWKATTVNTSNFNHNQQYCTCGRGGNLVNRILSLNVFTYLSKLSFVAYLIHLPLMSVFVSQTRGLFAFSHTLVIHLAMSYLVMTFILSFILVHIIEFPFITFERYLFQRFLYTKAPVELEKTERKQSTPGRISSCQTSVVLAPLASINGTDCRLSASSPQYWQLVGSNSANQRRREKADSHGISVTDANKVNEPKLAGHKTEVNFNERL